MLTHFRVWILTLQRIYDSGIECQRWKTTSGRGPDFVCIDIAVIKTSTAGSANPVTWDLRTGQPPSHMVYNMQKASITLLTRF